MLKHIARTVDDPALAAAGGVTLLCLVDGPGATWRLSFELPLRRKRAAGEMRLIVIEERAFEPFGRQQVRTDMTALLAELSPDVVLLSRCNSQAATILIDAAAGRGLPVIYHLDDDLFAVPKELGPSKFDFYHSPARQAVFRTCCERADLIYCSTEALCLRLGRFGFATPRTFGKIYCPAPEPFADYAPRLPRTIGYMGTGGHAADLDLIVPAIAMVMTNYSDVRFEVFGTLDAPEKLRSAFPERVRKLPPIADYDSFLDGMRQLGWAVALAPLKNTAFNAVKANTKFIEYTIAGLPVVVSDSQVYADVISGGAGVAATSVIDWINAIDRLLKDPAAARSQVERAQAKLRRDYAVDQLEQQVLSVLERAAREKSDAAHRSVATEKRVAS
jgi:glycosyltransferase involved in cell wall biosynthesis